MIEQKTAKKEIHRIQTLEAVKEYVQEYNHKAMSDNPAYPRNSTIKSTHISVLNHLYLLFLNDKLKRPPMDYITVSTDRGAEQWPQRFVCAHSIITRFDIASVRTFDAHMKRFEQAGLLVRKRLLRSGARKRRKGDHHNAIAFNPNLIRYALE